MKVNTLFVVVAAILSLFVFAERVIADPPPGYEENTYTELNEWDPNLTLDGKLFNYAAHEVYYARENAESAWYVSGGSPFYFSKSLSDNEWHILVENDGVAVITGTMTGFCRWDFNHNPEWFINTSETTGAFTSATGKSYTSRVVEKVHSHDSGTGVITGTVTVTGVGEGGVGNYSYSYNPATYLGEPIEIQGSEGGWLINGVEYMNSYSSYSDTSGSFELFGNTYVQTSVSTIVEYRNDATTKTTTRCDYASDNGGTFYDESWTGYESGGRKWGWDPYAGTFESNSANELIWGPRLSPTFTQGQIWVDGHLVSWTGGTITSSGVVTDTYTGTSGGQTLTLEIYGNVRAYMVSGESMTVTLNGTQNATISQALGFTSLVLVPGEPNATTPAFSVDSLWVGGSEFEFEAGWQHNDTGMRVDYYKHASLGRLIIRGNTSDLTTGTVFVSLDELHTGSFNNGVFLVVGVDVQTQESTGLPEAFWVRGRLFPRLPTGIYKSEDGYSLTCTLLSSGTTGKINGSNENGAFTGDYTLSEQGVFLLLSQTEGVPLPACPASANGNLILGSGEPPADFPPAIMVARRGVWRYLGSAWYPDSSTGKELAFYGKSPATYETDEQRGAISIEHAPAESNGSKHNINIFDQNCNQLLNGFYDHVTHLFSIPSNWMYFPSPMFAVDPLENNALWGLLEPASGNPATFLVRGQIWRYAGLDGNGKPIYEGYYPGQTLVLGDVDGDGLRLLTITDPVYGDTQGHLSQRGTARLGDGSIVYSGNAEGGRINPDLNQSNLHTIASDLDITGNVLTFGSLSGDAAVAGLTMQFQDDGTTARLHMALGRPASEWYWYKAGNSPEQAAQPMMGLDSGNRLRLMSPQNPAFTAILLDPADGAVSHIRGVLRVRAGGDISMGEFTTGGQP